MQLTQLGPYQIDRQIGKGGMGSVFEATDSQSGCKVAIKALNPQLALAEGFRERFEAEIESLKTLSHESIVRLYGYGEQNGVLFYSMELVFGSSLEDELKAGRRFDWREVTEIAIQLCSALKHAHDHGIIHRDIKPANILFADDQHVKLADFGIARLFSNASSLTTAGGVLGTADYMSPEQADGRPITARCDQYSLGGVMYALLAGRPPFRAKSLPEMLQLQRFAQPEPVTRYAPDTPKQLEGVIAQLLAKESADRFPNMAVLARHLQAMVMALTRPAHDSFLLAGEPSHPVALGPGVANSLALAVTQAETELPRSVTPLPKPIAANVARPLDGADKPATNIAETRVADKAANSPSLSSAAQSLSFTKSATISTPNANVFTTVEEDLARRKKQSSRPWVTVVAPLMSLAVALAALAALGWYLSRDSTAEELYAKISARAESDNPDSMRDVEREIGEFVTRFPHDQRSAQLREYQQRLELDKMHRQLLRHRGGIVDPTLLPVESLYLAAMNEAQIAPDSALAQLELLIDLYAAAGTPGNTDDRRTKCVQLAKLQLVQLRKDAANLEQRQLTAIRERLTAADKIVKQQPAVARAIFQAVVQLYGDRPWAAELVATANNKLAQLTATHEQTKP